MVKKLCAVFRSEEMECYDVVLPKSVAYQCISSLGELELIELISLNSPSEGYKFVSELQLLDSLDHKLRIMVKDLKQMRLAAITPEEIPRAPHPNELLSIGSHRRTSLNVFNKLYEEYKEISERCQRLKEELKLSVEKHKALLKGHKAMLEMESDYKLRFKTDLPVSEASAGIPFSSRFTVQVAVVPNAKCNVIETLIWRMTYGNGMTRIYPLEPIKRLGKVIGERKSVMLVSVQGVQSATKVTKLLQGYGIVVYYLSWSPTERAFILNRLLERIFELRGVLNEVNGHRKLLLERTADNCKTWFIEIEKMKATYNALNTMDWTTLNNQVILSFWVPKSSTDKVFRTLLGVTKSEGVNNPSLQKITQYTSAPPTYICTNKFTEGFQHIIDAYGIPSYRELNPMPYTIVTFPFIFAIMFGDCGHGFIMTTFAATIIILEKRIIRHGITNEIATLIFKGRYIILMMGLFSMWTGVIYNDYFAQSVFLYYTHWSVSFDIDDLKETQFIQLDPAVNYRGYPYELGVDPIWQLSENDILFTNALKMKMAIIVGVTQMTFGIFLNLLNHIHFKNYLAIFTEFFPQIIFFSCLFIYLVLLFFLKWSIYDAQGPYEIGPDCAPSVLITFINMVMFAYEANENPDCRKEIYPSQAKVQQILMITALLCVPIMFIVEPVIEIVRLRKNEEDNKKSQHRSEEGVLSIIVHQFIHVIEFCLGSVSYTASYLRLWALSLAHYQLSSVLWKLVLFVTHPSVSVPLGVILALLTFIAFMFFTVAVLVIIEGLSAFLHALRLHWMEFQSKFYIGLGHYFTPFSFKPILKEAKITQTNP